MFMENKSKLAEKSSKKKTRTRSGKALLKAAAIGAGVGALTYLVRGDESK